MLTKNLSKITRLGFNKTIFHSFSRGLFIAIEGLDRCGKSTQINLLKKYFEENEEKCSVQIFPERSTYLGSFIDEFLRGNKKVSDEVIHLLFSANRWEFK